MRKHITCSRIVYDAKQAQWPRERRTEEKKKKKNPTKINENAYQDSRMATHEIMHISFVKCVAFFFSASKENKKNLFDFLCADLRTSAMVVFFSCVFESHKYDNSKKFYHANEMFNRVPFSTYLSHLLMNIFVVHPFGKKKKKKVDERKKHY